MLFKKMAENKKQEPVSPLTNPPSSLYLFKKSKESPILGQFFQNSHLFAFVSGKLNNLPHFSS